MQFVASYFAYEPLANPVHYPEYLPSPSSVVSWQVMQHSNYNCLGSTVDVVQGSFQMFAAAEVSSSSRWANICRNYKKGPAAILLVCAVSDQALHLPGHTLWCLHQLSPQQHLSLMPSSQLGAYAQGGDCFDICTVLCSLLLGAGFDAYVVAGYAPLAVTVSDQTSALCPLLEPSTPKAKPHKMQPAASQKQPVQPKETKYQIKSDVKPESAFLQVQFHMPLCS